MTRTGIFWLAALLALPGAEALAAAPKVYVSVVATRMFIVGAANPRTGIHFQSPAQDTLWDHTGPNNTRAFSIAAYRPSNGQVLYIGAGNGVHKTTDGGQTWRVTNDWRMTEVLWVAPDETDPLTVYAATAYGIQKTTDGCQTWTLSNTGLETTFTPCVIVDRKNPRTLYCATESGAFRSDDRAATWQKVGLNVGGVRVIAQHPEKAEVLLVGTEDHGIYISRNGGRHWQKCESGIDHTTFFAIAFDPSNPETVYAGGYVTGVYKSTDGAKSWKRVNNGLSSLSIHSLAVDPTDGNRVYAAAYWGGVFRTDNGGSLWRHVGLADSCVWSVIIEP
jgi:photosystem II stability/assembly factor-like uncharacterized protein